MITKFVVLCLFCLAVLASALGCQKHEHQSMGHPTGDYCSKDGEFMLYYRKISGPNSCNFKQGEHK